METSEFKNMCLQVYNHAISLSFSIVHKFYVSHTQSDEIRIAYTISLTTNAYNSHEYTDILTLS